MQVVDLQCGDPIFRTLLDRKPSTKDELSNTKISTITSLTSINSPSPTDIQMCSLDSEESENSNPDLENALESYISEEIQCKITKILEEVQQLSDTEKLLLYLRLPGETCPELKDEFEQGQSLPISTTRAEQTQAFHWIRCHLEECDNNSTLPKHEVYDEYKAYCESMNAARTLSAPDFGKIIKCVFPRVKARRLGTRGNSKYCYSGIQRKKNVKPPTLPSLQIPSPSDKVKNNANQGNGMNGGDKIEEDQTLSAACLLVCEWANKLLGRVFTTLIELARFLVGGSYVSSKSMAAFVVMSNTDVSHPQLNHLANSLFSPQKHENALILTPKRKQSQQAFQKKMPNPRQKQSISHAILTDGSGNQMLPKTQVQIQTSQQHSPLHKQQVHIQPKPPAASSAQLQFYQQPPHPQMPGGTPGTPGYQKMRPPTPSLMSPNGPNQGLPQTPSPFQASPKFSAPGTPHRPMTPSSGMNQSRHTSNAIEPTRFLFTPITNEQKASKGDTSPPTLRPTATHPGNQGIEWQSGGAHQTQINLSEIPMSPNKQPRLSSQCAPLTPTRRPSSFPYPITSPRTPQRLSNQQYVTSPPMMSPNTSRSVINVQSPSLQQRGQEIILISQDGMGGMVTDALTGMRRGSDSSPTIQLTEQMIKQGCGPGPARPCRYSTSSDTSTMPPTPLGQQQSFDYSSELDSLCNTTVTNAGQVPPQFQRSQSVPPLPQHTLLDKRFHPLTPQTDTRIQQMTPSPMETTNSNQHLNGLKELRNRVLHGDVNNNGSRTNENVAFTARRNLTSLLNAEQGMNTNGNQQNLWSTESFQTGHSGSSSSEEQEMEMLESNLNFSDLTSDGDPSLPDLNTFDDATTEVVLRNICNNTSGVWPTSDVTSWGTQQPLQIMD